MNTLDKFIEQLTTPEKKQELKSFFGTIQNILKVPQPLNITENEESVMTVSQENGVPVVTLSRGFLVNLGNFKLTVRGGFTKDTVYEPTDVVLKETFTPGIEDHKRLVTNGWILFERDQNNCFHVTFTNGALIPIKDFNVLNHIKHNDLNEDLYKIVTDYLSRNNIKYYLVGEEWPEKSVEKENVKIQYVDRPVVVEKIKIVEKQVVVKEQVPVYVEKIVINEVYKCEHSKSEPTPVPTPAPVVSAKKPELTKKDTKKVTTDDVVKAVNVAVKNMPAQKSKTLPSKKIVDPDEDVDDKKKEESSSSSSSSSDDEEEESSTESTDNDEENEDEESSSSPSSSESDEPEPVKAKPASKKSPPKATNEDESVRVVKGRPLNKAKTIARIGEYVYRLVKKVNGPTDLEAIGRYDKKMWEKNQTTKPLTEDDEKKILKMGNKIARRLKN